MIFSLSLSSSLVFQDFDYFEIDILVCILAPHVVQVSIVM